jgi:hypothetical protein
MMMQWQYKTILFEFQKDGLLGDKYIDDEEAEAELNTLGAGGWELVNVSMIQEGLLAFCKRPAQPGSVQVAEPEADPQPMEAASETKPVDARMLQQEEREHIRHLEQQRRAAMAAMDRDGIGEIKIS